MVYRNGKPTVKPSGGLGARIRAFYRPAEAQELLPEAEQDRARRRYGWSVFLSIIFGYGFYYTCRLSLSVVKKPMIKAKLLNKDQLGRIGSVTKLGYAVGKISNGFLADRVNVRRLFITGITVSAMINVGFGLGDQYYWFLGLWALNGYFQGMGAPSSGVSIAQWYSGEERGTRYGIWSISHNLGEAATFLGTAVVVSATKNWRAGFLTPAAICFVVAFVLRYTMFDRPPSVGLPATAAKPKRPKDARAQQAAVLKNPWIWVLAVSSALMYMARYAINDWAVFYLQEEKGYGLVGAGSVTSLFPIAGIVGSAAAGWLSDTFFKSRRTPLSVICGLILIAGQALLYFGPAGHLDVVAMSVIGFAIGALLVYVGGLTAMDITPRAASGAALGTIGGMSYLGAALEDALSGSAIRRYKVGKQDRYDFAVAKYVWMVPSVASIILAATLWPVEMKIRRRVDQAEAQSIEQG